MLSVDVHRRLGDFELAAKFESAGKVTALFGASASGKTTIVNMIAGLMRPDRGRISINGYMLFDSQSGLDVAPHRRGIGYVFQEGRLFPHLTVAQNLDYGRWMTGLKRDDEETSRIVALLDIAPLMSRRPGKLSGGERQRIAIGRALMTQPKLLLLDEPLASLDGARKAEILPYLVRLRDASGLPMVYVSHHAAELRQIANNVVRLEAGRVAATGGLEQLGAASGLPLSE